MFSYRTCLGLQLKRKYVAGHFARFWLEASFPCNLHKLIKLQTLQSLMARWQVLLDCERRLIIVTVVLAPFLARMAAAT